MPKTVKIEIDPWETPAMIMGNENQICRLISNLVKNSAEAMEYNGRILIDTSKKILTEQDCLGHANARPGEFVTFTVSDTGPGISQGNITRIFDPFFSTKKVKSNAGLGLAIVYTISKDHSGWIDVESSPGQGTSLTVFFPAKTGLNKDVKEYIMEDSPYAMAG